MKVLIVNTSDINGGAARAAYRLHQALLSENIDSKMLVQTKSSDDFTVLSESSKIRKILNQFRRWLDQFPVKSYKYKMQTLFSSAWLPSSHLVDKINTLNPDIVHLHWVNGGMIRIEDLTKIKVPIVWSLHDMWLFTGGCHYDNNCAAYKTHCGQCKVLGSNKIKDLSHKIFNRKYKTFQQLSNLTVVGLSRWLENCARDSSLFKEQQIINLPNPINTQKFKALDKQKACELWCFPKDKKLILFGAMNATGDSRKGFKELRQALNQVKSKAIELVVFGSSEPKDAQDFGFKVHYIGNLHDDISLVTLYSAVDVLVVPSIQENLSNAIMESLSCETPVVGFDIGGNSDLIEHLYNGYLAMPLNATDLAKGIDWVLNNENYNQIALNARAKVLTSFDSHIVSKQYIALYDEILKKH